MLEQHTFQIVFYVVTGLISLVFFLTKDKINKLEEQVKSQTIETSKIKENYLSRFEKLNENIHSMKIEIIKEIHKIEQHIKR